MPKKKERIYWDSDCFLGFFNNEDDKIERCKYVVDRAHNGEIEIVYSVITLTEVIKMKGKSRIKEEQEETIKDFFDNDFLIPANVDEWIGTLARNLIWEKNTEPKDSIHVATAIYRNISTMNTFDKVLIKKMGTNLKLRNGDLLKISLPELPPNHYQEKLKFNE